MPLIDGLNKVFEVTGLNGDVGDATAGATNLDAFKRFIKPPRVGDPGLETAVSAPSRRRNTLYVPPGTYVIDPDPTVMAKWAIDLSLNPPEAATERTDRLNNAFGASVVFPAGTTLWLAPGAVLMPRRGCIIDISSLLVCEPVRCFDLNLDPNPDLDRGGLVVFGNAVPAVRPEWWGANPDEDASGAIRAAIDAAIMNRSVSWPRFERIDTNTRPPRVVEGIDTVTRPPLVVELRGNYRVGHSVKVFGDDPGSGILRQHNPAGLMALPSRAFVGLRDTSTVIRGAWSGGRRQGASLTAGKTLGQVPLFSLRKCPGISVRNIAFSTAESGYQPAVEIRSSVSRDGTVSSAAHSIAFRSCRFEGASTPVVQVGAHPPTHPADPPRSTLPYRDPDSEIGADLTFLAFDDCDFVVRRGGVGIDVRANQTLPVRFRRCDFSGDAVALMSLWNATHFLEGCRFQNSHAPLIPLDTDSPGSDGPDGSDIFLRRELSYLEKNGTIVPTTVDFLPGLTAIGCVSFSHRFLSTVRPVSATGQDQDWPVVLLNLRQTAPSRPLAASVRWGLQNHASSVEIGNRDTRPMSRGAPLAIIGGVLSSQVQILLGANQSAIVGVRVWYQGAAYPAPGVEFADRPPSGYGSTTIFGLPADRTGGRP